MTNLQKDLNEVYLLITENLTCEIEIKEALQDYYNQFYEDEIEDYTDEEQELIIDFFKVYE